jgi:hypothetical protein
VKQTAEGRTSTIRPFRIEIPQTDLDDLAAMEAPDLLVQDVRKFFRRFR